MVSTFLFSPLLFLRTDLFFSSNPQLSHLFLKFLLPPRDLFKLSLFKRYFSVYFQTVPTLPLSPMTFLLFFFSNFYIYLSQFCAALMALRLFANFRSGLSSPSSSPPPPPPKSPVSILRPFPIPIYFHHSSLFIEIGTARSKCIADAVLLSSFSR